MSLSRWVTTLLLSSSVACGALAGGFGFSIAGADITNNDLNNNGIADVGESFTMTGAKFSHYRSTAGAPAITQDDLDRYSADITGTVVAVVGQSVHYVGTFKINYKGPVVSSPVESGTLDIWADYQWNKIAMLRGLFLATPGSEPGAVAPFDTTDFSPYNSGRFFGVYAPLPGGKTGRIGCNMNAGSVGIAAALDNGVMDNDDKNGNGVADPGETFKLVAKAASYTSLGGPDITQNDLDRYTVELNGTCSTVVGRKATYGGLFKVIYTGPAYPAGHQVESGTFTMTADYALGTPGAARLMGEFAATPGAESTDINFKNTDFAIFNPGVFFGTYQPIGNGAKGSVSGSIVGGVLGFSASVAEAAVANADTNSNDRVDVGETFSATGPLSAYMAVGAPLLMDNDLNRYSLSLTGTATSVAGTKVHYDGTFTLTYTGPDLVAVVETGTVSADAEYAADGTAALTGTLIAKAGAEFTAPPFDVTDWAPFNGAEFKAFYAQNPADHSKGTLRFFWQGGTLVRTLVSRKVGSAIEGSPAAATLINTGSDPALDDARRVLVTSGSTLFVIDPATGLDSKGFKGGFALDGQATSRPAVLKDKAYVGTEKGTVYALDLRTGSVVSTGKPIGAGAKIAAIAPVDKLLTGDVKDQLIIVANTPTSSVVTKVAADNVAAPLTPTVDLDITPSTSSPVVADTGKVFVGTDTALYMLNYATLAPTGIVMEKTATSPLAVGTNVFVGTGTGQKLVQINSSKGTVIGFYDLTSPLSQSAFYENAKSKLIIAGVNDGRVFTFKSDGTPTGLAIAGLFNNEQTGGSVNAPVLSNGILYRGTMKKQIVSAGSLKEVNLNCDNQEIVNLVSVPTGAIVATGQNPAKDWVSAVNAEGIIHFIATR